MNCPGVSLFHPVVAGVSRETPATTGQLKTINFQYIRPTAP